MLRGPGLRRAPSAKICVVVAARAAAGVERVRILRRSRHSVAGVPWRAAVDVARCRVADVGGALRLGLVGAGSWGRAFPGRCCLGPPAGRRRLCWVPPRLGLALLGGIATGLLRFGPSLGRHALRGALRLASGTRGDRGERGEVASEAIAQVPLHPRAGLGLARRLPGGVRVGVVRQPPGPEVVELRLGLACLGEGVARCRARTVHDCLGESQAAVLALEVRGAQLLRSSVHRRSYDHLR
mmetsp:Transcript_52442/g.147177  ORF Transcript_52442/g.147177 Transcript_52442/m.147177 type:complete len:240 (-) Transcript_52442:1010-1729(-)